MKSWLIGKDSDAGRDWGQEEKGTTEDEMAGWYHWLNGRESEWTLGVGDGQGGLACCDSWGHKESDTTEWLNWTELNRIVYFFAFSMLITCLSTLLLPYSNYISLFLVPQIQNSFFFSLNICFFFLEYVFPCCLNAFIILVIVWKLPLQRKHLRPSNLNESSQQPRYPASILLYYFIAFAFSSSLSQF